MWEGEYPLTPKLKRIFFDDMAFCEVQSFLQYALKTHRSKASRHSVKPLVFTIKTGIIDRLTVVWRI